VDGVPADATAIIGTLSTYDSARNNFAVHTFGRNASHDCNIWNNRVYELNSYINDVAITHNGEAGESSFAHGHTYGTVVIPLKSNGRFDAMLAGRWSNTATHYITLQVYGYIRGYGFLSANQINNVRTADNTNGFQSISQLRPSFPEGNSASALWATITTFVAGASDHYFVSYGRNNAGSTTVAHYLTTGPATDTSKYLNDFLITHSGQTGQIDTYGNSHGSHLIPLLSDGSFTKLNNIGKDASSNLAYATSQVFGFVPQAPYTNIRFLPATSTNPIRFTITARQVFTDNIPPNVPTNAIAIIANIYTYQGGNNDDHMMHTFGRNANHAEPIFDNNIYTRNTNINDVIITHEGEGSKPYYYGFHHGTQIIPLKTNGRFDALIGSGKNDATTIHHVVLQIYGFVLRKDAWYW
jgi:hypothetical protein